MEPNKNDLHQAYSKTCSLTKHQTCKYKQQNGTKQCGSLNKASLKKQPFTGIWLSKPFTTIQGKLIKTPLGIKLIQRG